ncbi:amylosucrase [Aquiflexum balticum DSM 16537]|uniref:Amylosucrase n=1 Tax=Aquiflexum balticum DSM 16537 TaxID=758820 RepID=A0A1W2GXW2_9BACT|nr:alpha-amylase family glycosyl hydrolase [Aquiflexum balticum]SMD41535.1 amylosucrase [Aquiflexum balticum DSM 16537]
MASDHHQPDLIQQTINKYSIDSNDKDFLQRFNERIGTISKLYYQLYATHPKKDELFEQLIVTLFKANNERSLDLKKQDEIKSNKNQWFLSNELVGMSLYVDRFAGNLKNMSSKLDYLEELGVNFLHIMPVFESPQGESDGGYAVSDFRKVDPKFGTLEDLIALNKKMQKREMYLMLDIVLNHTSHRHQWAEKAKSGDPYFQDFYYMYDNRWIPNEFEEAMPEIFPEAAPGNFTWSEECQKWVMTVFHDYQWDLNYMNPMVLREMLDNVLFYANLGVDLLRVDAPAFIWKQTGTTCQNLPQVHTLLQLIKQCVMVSTPGMAILGEAIVAPKEITKYFGTGEFTAQECDFAYNAVHMALQWDMLATGETEVMMAAQHEILKKPYGTSWITYTRCHDDIGLGYENEMIKAAGKQPYEHRKFLMDYYSGKFPNSPARGELFSSNPKTGDARISGTLASLCGLEKGIYENDPTVIDEAIHKIMLMQAHSMFIGGLPMLFYGDEVGYTNDYSFRNDPGKSYDNRWMHRPLIDWKRNKLAEKDGSLENRIFSQTQKLIQIRKQLSVISDFKNLTWSTPQNKHVAVFMRDSADDRFFGVFNFSSFPTKLTWYVFREHTQAPKRLLDHWTGDEFDVGYDHEFLELQPYQFYLFEVID